MPSSELPLLGYMENPRNGASIIRARTTFRIFSWRFPRTTEALEKLRTDDFSRAAFPGIYILYHGEKHVYVGEAKNLYKRLKQHNNNPPPQIVNWDRALVINDGRSSTLSDFNDNTVRLAIEYHVNQLLKLNNCKVDSQADQQTLNHGQKHFVTSMSDEIDFILSKIGLINKTLETALSREVFRDDVKRMLENDGRTITTWLHYEATIDDEKYFIRTGSKKPSGFQITFRGLTEGSFIDCLLKDEGYLLVNRNSVLIIPLRDIRKAIIPDVENFDQDTIDIWIRFEENATTLRYSDITLDINDYKLNSETGDNVDDEEEPIASAWLSVMEHIENIKEDEKE
jgi:hypothetical protein